MEPREPEVFQVTPGRPPHLSIILLSPPDHHKEPLWRITNNKEYSIKKSKLAQTTTKKKPTASNFLPRGCCLTQEAGSLMRPRKTTPLYYTCHPGCKNAPQAILSGLAMGFPFLRSQAAQTVRYPSPLSALGMAPPAL